MDLTHVGVEVEHVFDAPIDDVFALITDVERMAGLGPEHTRAEWLDPERTRFQGWNGRGSVTWDVLCSVILREPPNAFAFSVGDDPTDPSSTWTYAFEAQGSRTLVHQCFQHGPGQSGVTIAAERNPGEAQAIIDGRVEYLRTGMLTVLRAAEALLTGTPRAD